MHPHKYITHQNYYTVWKLTYPLSDHLVVPHVPDILLLRPQDKIRDQGQK